MNSSSGRRLSKSNLKRILIVRFPLALASLSLSMSLNVKTRGAHLLSGDTHWKAPVLAFYGLAFNRTFIRIYLRANYSRWWALPCDLKEVPRKMGWGGVWWGILHRSQTALKVVQCCTLDRLQRLMSTVWHSPRAPYPHPCRRDLQPQHW